MYSEVWLFFIFSKSDMQEYREFVTNVKGSNAELASPIKITINKNNVGKVEKAILNEYCHDTPESHYWTIKASPYWDSYMMAYLNLERSLMDSIYVELMKVMNQSMLPMTFQKWNGE